MKKRDPRVDPKPGDLLRRAGAVNSLRVREIVLVPTVIAEIGDEDGRPWKSIPLADWQQMYSAPGVRILRRGKG